jgi:hypothetical protein
MMFWTWECWKIDILLRDSDREGCCSDNSWDQRVVFTELHTDTCKYQKCCDVRRCVCAAVNLRKLVSCLKLEYFQWIASLVTPYSIKRRHAVNSPVVSCDVSVPAEGKRDVSTASQTQTVLNAVTYSGLNGVDPDSRQIRMAASAVLSAVTDRTKYWCTSAHTVMFPQRRLQALSDKTRDFLRDVRNPDWESNPWLLNTLRIQKRQPRNKMLVIWWCRWSGDVSAL